MQSNIISHLLLVGMQHGIATLEDKLAIKYLGSQDIPRWYTKYNSVTVLQVHENKLTEEDEVNGADLSNLGNERSL